jgi:hypothetical protein
MQFTYPIPQKYRADEDDAGVVHDYLATKGYAVEGVSINTKDGTITIDCDRDPLNDLKLFDPPQSARQKAKAALAELNSIDIDAAPLADLRRALKLMRGLMNYDLRTP